LVRQVADAQGVLVAISVVPLVAILLYAFILLDRLLRTEYEHHRPAWEADGRPAGFFWRAKECGHLTSHLALMRVSFAWIFSTPAWVGNSAPVVARLRRLRFAVLIWNIGILIWFAMFLALLTK
jgi:hypothetical protein